MKDGIYEQVINSEIFAELKRLEDERIIENGDLDKSEAPEILSHYLGRVIERSLEIVRDDSVEAEKLHKQIQLANRIIEAINDEVGQQYLQPEIIRQGRILKSIRSKVNFSGSLVDGSVIRPERSLTTSSLFTGHPSDPSMMQEFKKEILSSDAIYMIVSFIKKRGVVLIYDELKYFSEKLKKPIYVITTTYIGASDFEGIELLATLPTAQVKVSYDTDLTRLHAKSYVFHRDSGYSTAYVGSSNLSKPAFTDGAEWNVKLTEQHAARVFQKMRITFDQYWNSPDFVSYDSANEVDRQRLQQALSREGRRTTKDNGTPIRLAGFDIRPYDFQKVILDMLQAEREIHGHYRNLVVAATGVGKTIISAFDYQRFLQQVPGARLLFVAHRQEILLQSVARYREILKDPNFGEVQTGNYQANSISHLFITIQSVASQNLIARTTPDYYDFVVVDEFHHAAAESYQALLDYYQPKVLLGLTATPERMDGKSILHHFNDRVASEMRLPEAIEKRLLVPFHYFCIDDDSVDLRHVDWGPRGYSETGLYNLYERVNHKRIRTIARSLEYYLDSIDTMKALGFCATVEHAELMSRSFNELEIPALCVTGKTDNETRNQAVRRLEAGEIRIIFTVDVYNEGVDIPAVNTVLFLRPTQSLTVFLQQLGRGLRSAPGKEQLTVLDFVAQAHENYSYEDKFSSLMHRSKHALYTSLKTGNISLPAGCHFQMEKIARDVILENIRRQTINVSLLRRRLRTYEQETGQVPTLALFLDHYHMSILDFYGADRSFSALYHGKPLDRELTKRLKNLITIDARYLLEAGLAYFRDGLAFANPKEEAMFYYSFYNDTPTKQGFLSMSEGLQIVRNMPDERHEIISILEYQYNHLPFVSHKAKLQVDASLEVGARYTRNQILAALGYFNETEMPAHREGVLYLKTAKTDVFFVTLNKSEKDYSEATMYQDYYISDELFHWQSQNNVKSDSETANRYRTHHQNQHDILLFVRENRKIGSIVSPYRFVGKVDYVRDEGSLPVSFVWKVG